MVFSKLFKKDDAPPPPKPEAEEEDDSQGGEPEAIEAHDETWFARARKVIPNGVSTGSKRLEALYGDESAAERYPTHFVKAAGCRLVTTEGDTLLDCTMALGSVALGYAEPQLTRAVIETLANGSVSGLSPALEVDVAERFCGVIPCAERVQFLKSGAEAVSAAVRIARTYTGRNVVIGCGYLGWHDWSSTAAGVPAATQTAFRSIPFDDTAALEKAVTDAGGDLAAIVIEPVIERLPSKEWIQRARALCDEKGAALIFDEMKTGFRIATGGYQQYAEITPDLAAFGKAMANGHPIAAVCGRADLMDAARKTWISSTLASEAGALAAVSAMLSWHERADICQSLWEIGKEMREAVGNALAASGVSGVTVDGIDPMWLIRFQSPQVETAFLLAAVENGVLFKRGAYNFAAIAHDDEAIREIESAASAAFVALREQGEDEE
jgi:glutamate-1-semialdehyde aminotransferase